MKRITILALISLVLIGCKEDKVPFPPSLGVASVVVDKEAQTVVMPIVADMEVFDVSMNGSVDWCTFEWSQSEIVATVQANHLIPREVSFTLVGTVRTGIAILKQEGRDIKDFKEYDKSNWEIANVCDEIVGDGGGAKSILEDTHDTYWHNNWSNAGDALPHWIVLDMKEELEIDMIQLGWRQYGDKFYYNNRVTEIYIGNSPDPEEITNKVGSLTTIPAGSSHSSDQHQPYHNVGLAPAKGRYLKLGVTESNSGQTSIIAYVKAFKYEGND